MTTEEQKKYFHDFFVCGFLECVLCQLKGTDPSSQEGAEFIESAFVEYYEELTKHVSLK